jgi:endonuclease YncB( thermonuclease family)
MSEDECFDLFCDSCGLPFRRARDDAVYDWMQKAFVAYDDGRCIVTDGYDLRGGFSECESASLLMGQCKIYHMDCVGKDRGETKKTMAPFRGKLFKFDEVFARGLGALLLCPRGKLWRTFCVTREGCFDFVGAWTTAKVLRVIDGDTCEVALMCAGVPILMKARLYGYDSPEMHPPKGDPGRDETKRLACAARETLCGLVLEKALYAHCHKLDKYGRPLLTLWSDDPGGDVAALGSINELMLRCAGCRAYYGGKKPSPEGA